MNFTTVGQFFLVIMACSAHVVLCSFNGNETDQWSLHEFKKAISFDPQQALMSWNDSTYFCNWEGVSCRLKNPRRVASLYLSSRGLVGYISPSLGNLTFLKHLFLSTNKLTGQIPPSLGHLHHLQSLYLTNNTLKGRIPAFANCSDLRILQLDNNQLVGGVPIQVNLPPRLNELHLAKNNLTGTIPSSLANISTLTVFSCVTNHIKGNIPNEFGKLPMLRILYVGMNMLSGWFQPTLLNLSTLTGLSFTFNGLSGEVPSNLGNSLPNLEILELDDNFFEGHLPCSLVNASKLYFIDVAGNNFTGMVPSSIGKLTELSWLNLESNELRARNKQDWQFMYSLTNCTELQAFSISDNRLEGQVPNSLGNLSNKLQFLYLGINQLSGGFPSGVANLPNLITLGLEQNQLTGELPEWIGTIKNLQIIGFFQNYFSGSIPSSLSNLSQLGEIYLSWNQLDGHIPPSFGNLQNLRVLNISNNNLRGNIPKEIFNISTIYQIELSFNNLDGQLPVEIGNAKQLVYLKLSSNKLSEYIPNTLTNCESMEDIILDWNFLRGVIPASLGNIKSLNVLNLSHNNLSGSIPESLVGLQFLDQLDLSFNQLGGRVPAEGIFRNVTASQINGNQGLCGGVIELHLPTCSVMPSSSTKKKQSIVLKVVIPFAGMVSLAIVISVSFLWRKKQKRKSISLPSFDTKFPKVSYNDLARATNGFSVSNLIGSGRYSSVYQGALFQDRNIVAVKVFSLETRGAQKSFIAECNALRNVRHRNLVPILTACSSIDAKGNDFKALVYEFMPRGDLHVLLYSTRNDQNTSTSNYITLAQRLSIVVDVADALEYLHHNNQGTIVHCDLKPSNILLDDNMTAHVGDFGLARFNVDFTTSSLIDSNSTSSLAIKGTVGYVAPECAGGNQVQTASDVYSFGVVLLEIFIRRRPTDDMFKDGLCIAKFTEMNFPDEILQIADPQLRQELVLCQETPTAVKESKLPAVIMDVAKDCI